MKELASKLVRSSESDSRQKLYGHESLYYKEQRGKHNQVYVPRTAQQTEYIKVDAIKIKAKSNGMKTTRSCYFGKRNKTYKPLSNPNKEKNTHTREPK